MLDLFFSSQYLTLRASACSLQRPLLEAASPKALKKKYVRSLDTFAASQATFCLQPTNQVGRVTFLYKLFSKSSSCPFKSGFRLPNQSANNVTSVTTKTAFLSTFLVTHVERVGSCRVFGLFWSKLKKIAEMPFNVLSQYEGYEGS